MEESFITNEDIQDILNEFSEKLQYEAETLPEGWSINGESVNIEELLQ